MALAPPLRCQRIFILKNYPRVKWNISKPVAIFQTWRLLANGNRLRFHDQSNMSMFTLGVKPKIFKQDHWFQTTWFWKWSSFAIFDTLFVSCHLNVSSGERTTTSLSAAARPAAPFARLPIEEFAHSHFRSCVCYFPVFMQSIFVVFRKLKILNCFFRFTCHSRHSLTATFLPCTLTLNPTLYRIFVW